MSRAVRRYSKWERQAREGAWEDARWLALDLYHGRAGPIGTYDMGLALERGEVLYRQAWPRYSTLGAATDLVDNFGRVSVVPAAWRDWGWCQTVVTSHRLATRLAADGCTLVSNWWANIGGVQVDLACDVVVLDGRAGSWRGAYRGPAAALVAVAAVERVHGPAALIDHPALEALRDLVGSDAESAGVISRSVAPKYRR